MEHKTIGFGISSTAVLIPAPLPSIYDLPHWKNGNDYTQNHQRVKKKIN